MSEDYFLKILQANKKLVSYKEAQLFFDALDRLSEIGTSENLGELLLLFTDGVAYFQALQDLLTCIEKAEITKLVPTLIAVTPAMTKTAPQSQWCKILYSHILNNQEDRTYLKDKLKSVDQHTYQLIH